MGCVGAQAVRSQWRGLSGWEMSDSVKPEDSKGETITIRVKDQSGEETLFKVRRRDGDDARESLQSRARVRGDRD
jgi:hypothetical protein